MSLDLAEREMDYWANLGARVLCKNEREHIHAFLKLLHRYTSFQGAPPLLPKDEKRELEKSKAYRHFVICVRHFSFTAAGFVCVLKEAFEQRNSFYITRTGLATES